MKNLVGKMVMLSAYTTGRSVDENKAAQTSLIKYLRNTGLHFTSAIGVYNGAVEESVAVFVDDQSFVHWALELAEQFEQESILVRYTDKSCYLVYTKDIVGYNRPPQHYIGQWTSISRERAGRLSSITIKDDRFFAAI